MRSAYRPDVDGLRAIAVVAVVLFHLAPNVLCGGFAGVDVFFVVSGFLITRLLISEIDAGTFSMRRFMLRRIRRLAPALLLVCLASASIAFLLLPPGDLSAFGKSLVAQPFALQNIGFLVEGEYFRGSETKPLLHTWSLAVEEQFYIAWPLFLILALRRGRGFTHIGILVLSAGSFGFAYLVENISPKVAFFTLPGRAWELAAGGVLNLLPSFGQRRKWFSSMAAIGLLASFVLLKPGMLWPDARTLWPVACTLVLLQEGDGPSGAARRILSHPAAVFVGKRSYSWYLWHWPAIVFCPYAGVDPHRPVVAICLVFGSFVLAHLSFLLVEEPVRRRRALLSRRQLLATVGAGMSLLIAFGIFSLASRGALFRYSGIRRALLAAPFDSADGRCGAWFRIRHPSAAACQLKGSPDSDKRILLWGNSHAETWMQTLEDIAQARKASLYLSAKNCPPVPSDKFCDQALEPMFDFIRSASITDVIVAFTWYTSTTISHEEFERAFLSLTERLTSEGVRLWLVIDVPQAQEFLPEHLLAHEGGAKFGEVDRRIFEREQREPQLALAERAKNLSNLVSTIDPTPLFCDHDKCRSGMGEVSWYRDSNHLTQTGAMRGATLFFPVFEK